MAAKTYLILVACTGLVHNANAAVTLVIESKTIGSQATAVADSLQATFQVTGAVPLISGYDISLVLSGASSDVKFTGVATPMPYLLDPSSPSTPILTDSAIRVTDSIAPAFVPLTSTLIWSINFEAAAFATPGDYVIAADPLMLSEIQLEIAQSLPVVIVEGTVTIVPEPSCALAVGAAYLAYGRRRGRRGSC